MSVRSNVYAKNYPILNDWIGFARKVADSGLEKSLVHLVEIRSSQINGCVVCLDMHSKDALKHGETAERIIMLPAWRESNLYTPRERAALALTEALVRLAETGAPEEVYQQVADEFSGEEQVKLTLMIGVINTFNKLGVGFRVPPIGEQQKAA